MVLRFVLAGALTTAAMALSAPTALAGPDCPSDANGQCLPIPGPALAPPPPPPAPPPPPRPTRVALCKDGSISFTQHTNFQGTCAEEGGAVRWLIDAPPTPAP